MAKFLQHPDRDPAAAYGWKAEGGNFVDVFRVEVPADAADTTEDRARIAFAEAEDVSQWFFLPCVWEALSDVEIGGDIVLVKRTRAARRCDGQIPLGNPA